MTNRIKILSCFSFLLIFGCALKEDLGESSYKYKAFDIGDINGNQKTDSAFIYGRRIINSEKKKSIHYVPAITVAFTGNIPNLSFENSNGLIIKKTFDVNNDKANEILVFSKTNEGYWNDLSIWTFKKKRWKKLGETKAFISEDKDLENRIINQKRRFYLVGQNPWREDEKGNFKVIKVKI